MTDHQRPRVQRLALSGTRLIAALALLATGGIHLEQYIVANYGTIPTIGPLFMVNFISATLLGLYFLVPWPRQGGHVRWLTDRLAILTAWTVAAGALVALLLSEHTTLFGFMEHGYRREIVIAIVAEAVSITALGALLVLTRRPKGGATAMTPASSHS